MDNRTRNRILGVLFVGVMMGALDIAIVGPALTALQEEFGVGERALSWILSIYVLCTLISTPLMAKLSDRAGRRPIYILDVLLFAAGSLIVALSPSFAVLLVGRAVQGIGAGGIFPIAAAVIGDTFPPDKRGRALGLIGAVFGLAFIVGPILGGVLLKITWHLLFYINLPIALFIIIAALRVIPATRTTERKPFDWAGLAILTVLLLSLSFGLNQLGGTEFRFWPLLLLAAGMALLAIFGAVESRAADPIFRFHMLNSRQMLLATALAFGSGMGMLAVSFLPTLLMAAFALSKSAASFMLIPLVLAMTVGSPLAGRLLDSSGSRSVIIVGTALLAIGLLLLSLVTLSHTTFYAASAFIGLGLSALLGAPIRYIVINAAPAEDRAAAQGGIAVVSSVGQLICSALMGAIAGSFGGGTAGLQTAYLFIACITLGMLFAAFGLKVRSDEMGIVRESEGDRTVERDYA